MAEQTKLSEIALEEIVRGAKAAQVEARFRAHYNRKGVRAVFSAADLGANIAGLKGAELLAVVDVELGLTPEAPETTH